MGKPVRQLVEPITVSPVTALVALVAERPDVSRVFPTEPPISQVMHLKPERRLATVTAPAFGFGEGGLTATVPLRALQVSPVSLSPTSPPQCSNPVLDSV